MPIRHRTTARAIVFTAALASTLAQAQEAEGLTLKLDRRLKPAPRQLERDAPRFLEADRIEGERERGLVATGT